MPDRISPLLIAPWIEVASLRDWVQQVDVIRMLEKYRLTLDLLLSNFLNTLQLNSSEKTPLGYTVAINVYDLFSQDDQAEWHFDPSRMEFFTGLFLKVGRPVVVNLRANHFVGEDPLVAELMSHEDSYARLNDDAPVQDLYYSNPMFGPTFSLDERIPLNQYRFGGFRQAASMLAEFDRQHPGIIHAVTLAGELHHFLPELANPMAAGQFDGARMTDYSPQSIRDFIAWLKPRHETISQLNARFGTSFASWEEVEPPRWDFRANPEAPAWSQMDSYADGLLPVFGWAKPYGSVVIYLDAKPLGKADYGLSRLDVYDNVPILMNSDVGFRFTIDYRKLTPGRHILHIVLEKPDGSRYLMGARGLNIEGSPQGNLDGIDFRALDILPGCEDEAGSFAWLDHPPDDLALRFNPYAAEWQEFREFQVEVLLTKFAEIAVEAGIAPEKLYSHQIMPQFEGSWNRVAFAVTEKVPAGKLFLPGLDLYGGACMFRGLPAFLQGVRYGVPELHPRMGKYGSREIFLKTLQYHRDLGASFISPYFMALREPAGQRATTDPQNLQDALLIHPLNIAVGSLFFHSALVRFLNSEPLPPAATPAAAAAPPTTAHRPFASALSSLLKRKKSS
jgi:hypothetical protein